MEVSLIFRQDLILNEGSASPGRPAGTLWSLFLNLCKNGDSQILQVASKEGTTPVGPPRERGMPLALTSTAPPQVWALQPAPGAPDPRVSGLKLWASAGHSHMACPPVSWAPSSSSPHPKSPPSVRPRMGPFAPLILIWQSSLRRAWAEGGLRRAHNLSTPTSPLKTDYCFWPLVCLATNGWARNGYSIPTRSKKEKQVWHCKEGFLFPRLSFQPTNFCWLLFARICINTLFRALGFVVVNLLDRIA